MIRANAFLENWGITQDYGWFLAAVFWVIAMAGFKSRRHWGRAMPWLVAFAAANLAMPLLEMAHYLSGPIADNQIVVRLLTEDMLIGATPALAAVFLAAAGLCSRPAGWLARRINRLILLGLALLLAESYGVLRRNSPVAYGVLLGILGLALVVWLARRRILFQPAARWYWFAGLGLWGLLLWCTTTGPLAYLALEGRGLYQFSRFSAPAQLLSLGAAVAFASTAWRVRLHAGQPGSAWAEMRPSVWSLAAWLAFGCLFLVLSTWWSRHDYEANLLRRAHLVAAYLNKDALDEALGPKFQLGPIKTRPRLATGSGAQSTLTYTHYADGYSPTFDLLRDQLKPALLTNSDFWSIELIAERQGWMAMVVKWQDYHNYFAEIILRPAENELDRVKQAGPDGLVFGPTLEPWGYMVHVFVPVYGRTSAQSPGWLEIQILAINWAVEFNRTRLQALIVLSFGILLWGTVVGLRLRRLRQVEAESLAMSAVAADQAKSRFLAHVSHELRTPLQGMLGYAELMAAGSLEPEQRRRLDAVLVQGVVLKRLVNDLIDLGAIAAGSFRLVPTVFHPLKLAQECVDAVRPNVGAKQLDLVLRCDASLTDTCTVLADAVRLRQVLLNLLGNAVKFTPAGTVALEIALRDQDPEAHTVQLGVVVRDNGPGIPAALRSRLFKPFSTLGLQADKEGAGLGLAISSAIAKEMGGELVLLESGTPGTAFQLHVMCQRTAWAEISVRSAAQVPWSQLTLLVADDNLLVRTWLTEFFATRGARVETVTNGLDAVRACSERQFDLVILDISMPMLDGWTAARQLRESAATRGKPRLVGLSAHAAAADHQRAGEAGFDVFLTKPIGLAELTAALAGLRLGDGVDAKLLPTGSDNALLKRMEALYWRELPQDLERLRSALAAGDRHGLATAAHHLKNSADITRQVAVARLCQQLQTEAESATVAQLDAMVEKFPHVCSTGSIADQSGVKIRSD